MSLTRQILGSVFLTAVLALLCVAMGGPLRYPGIALFAHAALTMWHGLSRDARLGRMVADANFRHGTQFDIKEGFGFRDCVLFDPKGRKIFMMVGNCYRVEDLSFIRRHVLKWDVISGLAKVKYKNIRFEFETADYNLPTLTFYCHSKQQADYWKSRLNLLFLMME